VAGGLLAALTLAGPGLAPAGINYANPAGGWDYSYDGASAAMGDFDAYDSLDGTWDHNNGSDLWTDPSKVTSDGNVLTIIDNLTAGDDRKFYFGHDLFDQGFPDNYLDAGVTLSFRARHTAGGYQQHDGGKSNIGLAQIGDGIAPPGIIGFCFGGASGSEGLLVGNAGSFIPFAIDTAEFHEYYITIQAGTVFTHQVSVYVDGGLTPELFDIDISTGSGDYGGTNFVAMGAGASPQTITLEIDFLSIKNGVHAPQPLVTTEPISAFSASPSTTSFGQPLTLTWFIDPAATSAEITADVGDAPGNVLDDTMPSGAGSVQVTPAVDTTYTLTVVTPTGNESEMATASVRLLDSFSTASARLVDAGAPVGLEWKVRPDATVSITPDVGNVDAQTDDATGLGSIDVPLDGDTMFEITATVGADSETAQVTVFQRTPSVQVYPDPVGGWDTLYDGAADFTALGWTHANGSDEWDGSEIGDPASAPGGVSRITEGDDHFLRLQDTGDPRDFGFPDPGSNRKVMLLTDLTGDIASGDTLLDDGVTLHFRARVATSGLLDEAYPAGELDPLPWPANGDGWIIHDGGKGMVGVHQAPGAGAEGTISFSLCTLDTGGLSDIPGPVDGLTMNGLDFDAPSGAVDTGEAFEENFLEFDPRAWHEFWVTIVRDTTVPPVGTHVVSIYRDGSEVADVFTVTSGDGEDATTPYLAMALGATPNSGAVDIDYVHLKQGVFVPQPGPGPAAPFRVTGFSVDFQAGNATLTWLSEPGATYSIDLSPDGLKTWNQVVDSIASGGASTSATVPLPDPVPDAAAWRVVLD
jgi:hypothetical protein